MVKARRMPEAAPQRPTRRASDLVGLALFFLGAACLLWLAWRDPEPVPDFTVRALRLLAGSGAYAVPVILMFVGSMFLIGYERFQFSYATYGSFLLFLTFVTWRHVSVGMGDRTWDEARIMVGGGYIGAVLGTVFLTLLGLKGSYLLLLMMGCMSVVLLVERPFAEVLRMLFGKPAVATVRVAKQGAAAIRDRRNGDREERAARVADRALPAGGDSNGSSKWLGFLSVRNGQVRSPDGDRPDPHPALPEPASSAPVKLRGGVTVRKQAAAGEQPAFPTLEAEAGGDGAFKLPPLDLLTQAALPLPKRTQQELADKIKVIEQSLENFRISANVVEIAHGPTVTRYEIQLAPGIRVAKIVSLADNLAMDLAAIDVRVEAPIPGKSAIGIEVPNANPTTVTLRECIDTPEYWNSPSKLTFALGKDVAGQVKYADLAKMPHLLVAGSTNAGKSVCLNSLIASLIYRAKPAELRFIMIDPKRVELSLWDGIPHLLHPVVKDIKQTAGIFKAAIKEMERRYDLFARMQTRNIEGYNQRVPEEDRLPYIVIVVDELADLMMQAAAEIETSICRLAQLARATGIHLVIATQRPSVDVITGLIKANISSRIAFAVSSQVDSRTILDMNGAERLIGRGDMLFLPIDASKPVRIQGCFLSEAETNALVAYLKEQESPHYTMAPVETGNGSGFGGDEGDVDDVDDELFERAVRLVVTNGQASTSMLQRRFKIGYTRAARIVDVMQERGIVGPPDGAKPREILVTRMQVEDMFRPGGDLPDSVF